MSRHSKQASTRAFFTSEERAKLKYGTVKERLGSDSLRAFDSCSLCLHPVINPVICPEGHIYCKECVLENILSQKKENQRKQELYEQQLRHEQEELKEKQREENEKAIQHFDKLTSGVLPVEVSVFKPKNGASSSSLSSSARPSSPSSSVVSGSSSSGHSQISDNKKLASYWTQVPAAFVSKIPKPANDILCHEGRHPLKMKQLIKVNFDVVPGAEEDDPKHVKNGRFQCPCCRKAFNNNSRVVLLKECGHALDKECCDRFVVKEKKCIVCDAPVVKLDKEIIALKLGGTGYAAHSDNPEQLFAKKYTPGAAFG